MPANLYRGPPMTLANMCDPPQAGPLTGALPVGKRAP
jgi:hypothetical protein